MILVTGGTGLVGSHLLLHLVRQSQQVRVIHRKGSNLDRVKEVFSYYVSDPETYFNKIEWLEANITDLVALEKAFTGIRQVYHCAAYISFDKANYDKMWKSNTAGTANVVNMCLATRVDKLCYVSSIATLGAPNKNGFVTEESNWDYSSSNPYAITKHQAEMEVWRGNQEGLKTVIVNPGVILGPGFWNKGSGTFFRMASKGMSFYLPGGSGFITVNDVVKIMIALMQSEVSGERFIAIDQNLSFKELLSNISREFGHPPPSYKIRIWQLQLLRPLDWLKSKIFRTARNLTGSQIKALSKRRYYSNEKVVKALDYDFELLAGVIYFTCNRFKEANPRLFA